MGKDKLGTSFRLWLDDRSGIPADLSGDLLPGSFSGGGLRLEEIEMTGVSNTVRNHLGGHAEAPITCRMHINDSDRQSLDVIGRMLGRAGTLAAMYGAGGAAPAVGDPLWTGEYIYHVGSLIPDGGRWLIEAGFYPAKGSTPAWHTYSVARTIAALGSSLIQFLPLNDLSGSTAADASGNGRNGSYVGTYTQGIAGPIDFGLGYGVNLNATGEIDGYSASLAGAFNSDTGMLAFWVRPNSATYWRDANIYNLFFLGVSGTMYLESRVSINYISFIDSRAGTSPFVIVTPPTSARWLHVAYTWDKPNDQIAMYINGSKIRPASGLGTWSGSLAANYVRYGDTSPSLANRNWPGRMSQIVLTNAIPSDSVIWGLAENPSHQVVFDGDSRSVSTTRWTAESVDSAFPDGEICFGGRGVTCAAISGLGTSTLVSGASTRTDTLLKSGVTNTLVVWCGVNDHAILSAAQIYANLQSYCLARRAAGWNRILICTEIDAQGAVSASWHTTTYPGLNTLLRAGYSSFADGLIDLGADSRLQDATDTTYYNVDQVHPADAGFQVIASIAAPVIAALAI